MSSKTIGKAEPTLWGLFSCLITSSFATIHRIIFEKLNCPILPIWLSYREYILLSYYNTKMLKMWSKPCVKMHFWPVPMKTFREIFGLMDTLTTELLNTGAAGCFFRTHLHSQKFQIFRFHSDFSASHFFCENCLFKLLSRNQNNN